MNERIRSRLQDNIKSVELSAELDNSFLAASDGSAQFGSNVKMDHV